MHALVSGTLSKERPLCSSTCTRTCCTGSTWLALPVSIRGDRPSVLCLFYHLALLHTHAAAARKDIVPGLIPRMGAATKAFPLQVQTLRVVDAAPLPTIAYQPIIGGRPHPGPLEFQRLHALAIEMLSPLPPELLLRIAGMLHQLHALGLPQEGLLSSGTPL